MKVIGITGGIGAGKSKVVDFLLSFPKTMGIFTDEVAKDLMKPNEAGYQKLVEFLGEEFLLENKEFNKEKLSAIFSDEILKEKINSIIHPLVINECKKLIEGNRDKTLIFLESAILFEANVDLICDEVWYIDASETLRMTRLMDYRGYKPKEALQRIKGQKNQDINRLKSNFIVQNNQDFEYVIKTLTRKLNTYYENM